MEAQGEDGLLSYGWSVKKGVALCPYPNGVVFTVFQFSQSEHCGRTHGEEVCSHEYDTKAIPQHSGARGGSFTYTMRPGWSGYLAVRGYYVRH